MSNNKYKTPNDIVIYSDEVFENFFEEEGITYLPHIPTHDLIFFPEVPKHTCNNTLIITLSKYLDINELDIKLKTKKFKKKVYDKKVTLLVTSKIQLAKFEEILKNI